MEGKVLIANRGEIAIRIMNGCRDLDLDYVVVYTEADRDSLHVRQNITSGPDQNAWRITSYSEPNDIFAVADHCGCTAIHPGYGFLSENADFAVACEENNITFIGPKSKAIKMMGSKLAAKEAVKAYNIPMVPGTFMYKAVQALLGIATLPVGESGQELLVAAGVSGVKAGMIVLALAFGIAAPLLLLPKRN